MRFTGSGITSCYLGQVDNFISITVLKPILGGLEYAEDIVQRMNLDRAGAGGQILPARFVEALRTEFRVQKS